MLRIDSVIGIRRIILDGPIVCLDAEMISLRAICPSCQAPSTRVHARYVRRPMDLPWRAHTARLILTVRRFRCDNPVCQRQTFAEDCGPNLARFARCTLQVTAELIAIAMVGGGESGSRLACKQHLPVSPDTLLRLQRQLPLSEYPAPRVLGIDDFSLRRGHNYATIFVDLETHKPIDVVEDREAKVVEDWLKRRPGVHIIVRDRSGAYADGAKAGAPQAVQVADRFHLVQSASRALEEVLRSHRRHYEYLADQDSPPATATSMMIGQLADGASEQSDRAGCSTTRHREVEQRQERVAQWRQVKRMREAGQSLSQIAQTLNLDRRTVRRYLSTPESLFEGPPPKAPGIAPEAAMPEDTLVAVNARSGDRVSPLLRPHVSYLQERWQAGCFNVSRLFREIGARGYTGSRTTLSHSLQAWRAPPLSKQAQRQRRHLSLRWLVLRPPEQLRADQKLILEEFLAKNEDVARGYELLQSFRQVVSARDIVGLARWQAAARQSELVDFVGLANGIDRDHAAVVAALELPWSNGPVEGQITRVKLIKRQGYGRAKFDLLRKRVLAA